MQQIDDDLFNEWVTVSALEESNIDILVCAGKSSGAMALSEENMSRSTV